jgi:phospholipid N-methyltransferase
MVSPVDWQQCRAVAELGAGTGRITEVVLRRLAPGARLLLFERDPAFRVQLQERFPGLPVFAEAGALPQAMAADGLDSLDAIICGLPLSILPADRRGLILAKARAALRQGGSFVAFQYTPYVKTELEGLFRQVAVSFVLRNLPPAFVYTCTR